MGPGIGPKVEVGGIAVGFTNGLTGTVDGPLIGAVGTIGGATGGTGFTGGILIGGKGTAGIVPSTSAGAAVGSGITTGSGTDAGVCEPLGVFPEVSLEDYYCLQEFSPPSKMEWTFSPVPSDLDPTLLCYELQILPGQVLVHPRWFLLLDLD
ncbi:hypothetical protein R1sor_005556 [Riccia sorocarpa]|uniref:Glycine-rich protein n=1 Tax=Riccia sorocarpa TaxID=122646 RepID=A0ABD3HJV3_9MARC